MPPVKTCARLRWCCWWCWWGWEERRRDGDKRRWEIKDLSPQHQQRANSLCVKLPDNSEETASVETGCPAEPLRDSLGLEMRRSDKLPRSAVDLTGGASKFIFLLPFPPSLLLSSSPPFSQLSSLFPAQATARGNQWPPSTINQLIN